MNQKGLVPLSILLVFILIIGTTGVLFYFNQTRHNPVDKAFSVQPLNIKPTPTASLNNDFADYPDLQQIPIYPNASVDPNYFGTGNKISDWECVKSGDILKVDSYHLSVKGAKVKNEDIYNWYKSQPGFTSNWSEISIQGDKTYDYNFVKGNLEYYIGINYGALNINIAHTDQKYNWPSISGNELGTWKTYFSNDGFTFKYPPQWSDKLIPPKYDAPVISIEVKNSGLSSNVYATKDISSEDPSLKPFLLNRIPEYLKDFDATIACGFSGARNPGPVLYIARGGKVIRVFTDSVDYPTVSKIFSTIKFTN